MTPGKPLGPADVLVVDKRNQVGIAEERDVEYQLCPW